MPRSAEYLGIEIRNHIKKLRKKRKGKRKECAQRIGIIKKTKELRKAHVKTGTTSVLRMGVVPGRVRRH